MYWFKQSLDKPDATAHSSKRGLVVLPSLEACYSTGSRHELGEGYSVQQRKALLSCLRSGRNVTSWPRDKIWDFRATTDRVFGSPLLDAVHTNKELKYCVAALAAWQPQMGIKGFFHVSQSPKRRRGRATGSYS